MKAQALGIALVAAFTAGSAAQADTPASNGEHQCVSLQSIKETPAIDDRTILIKLRARDKYMRADLTGPCPGLTFHGFEHETRIDQLCTADPLRVIQPVGATCSIQRIVDITPDEAKALLAKRR